MSAPPDSFLQACREQDLSLSPEQIDKLSRFVEHLLVVNLHMNLTAARDAESVWLRHVFDSLLLLNVLKHDPGQRALDLGSGGGFPGIPLAICRPDLEWVLVDSVQKKAKFLEETVALLGLENVKVSSQRAEVLGRDPEYREQFHLVTARAVARLPVLLEWTIPLLRVKGFLLAMKGAKAVEELVESERAIERLFLRLRKQQEQPGGGTLLLFKKFAPTPGRYPRMVGVASSDPL
jgi:16S rRNA (guanine527-N7)-methyltransferase